MIQNVAIPQPASLVKCRCFQIVVNLLLGTCKPLWSFTRIAASSSPYFYLYLVIQRNISTRYKLGTSAGLFIYFFFWLQSIQELNSARTCFLLGQQGCRKRSCPPGTGTQVTLKGNFPPTTLIGYSQELLLF